MSFSNSVRCTTQKYCQYQSTKSKTQERSGARFWDNEIHGIHFDRHPRDTKIVAANIGSCNSSEVHTEVFKNIQFSRRELVDNTEKKDPMVAG